MKREQTENNARLGKCIAYVRVRFVVCLMQVWVSMCETIARDRDKKLSYLGDTKNDKYSVQPSKTKEQNSGSGTHAVWCVCVYECV